MAMNFHKAGNVEIMNEDVFPGCYKRYCTTTTCKNVLNRYEQVKVPRDATHGYLWNLMEVCLQFYDFHGAQCLSSGLECPVQYAV